MRSLVYALLALPLANALTWCGKNYMQGSPVIPPGGQFPVPAKSTTPLLALQCSQAIRPYLPEDKGKTDGSISILIDTPVVFSHISNAAPITLFKSSSPGSLSVTVSANGKTIASGNVPLNATKHALPFDLSKLTPQAAAYELSCTASFDKQTFKASGSLTYLPAKPASIGSVTKMDLRTGAMLARPANGKGGDYKPVFPIGFYSGFDNYLAQDLTIPDTLKSQGFTVIHPIPDFNNLTALDLVLDAMQEAGLYLMYDMRNSYMNASSVTDQVNRIKSRPNLLLWYTADEPDGPGDPLDATLNAKNLITSLDGGDGAGGAGYHPVSLVLNCENFEFNSYANGADIVMQDVYSVSNNNTFSAVYGTVCNKDFGVCGCDNCIGSFTDISTRMEEIKERLFVNGWERTKAIWTVPQGFGNESFWTRDPTGKEFIVESIVGINHGALGVVSWDDPTTADIKTSASALALALPKMTPFIFNPSAAFNQITTGGVDVGLWTVGSETLVLASNMNYESATVRLQDIGLLAASSKVKQVFDSGSLVDSVRRLVFESVGSGGFVVSK